MDIQEHSGVSVILTQRMLGFGRNSQIMAQLLPLSLIVLLGRQVWTPFALVELHIVTDPVLEFSFSNIFLP